MDSLSPDDVRRLFLDRTGLRLGPETCAYVLRRWQDAGAAAAAAGARSPQGVPVMAGDARTGVPVRKVVDLAGVLAVGDGATPRAAHPRRPLTSEL